MEENCKWRTKNAEKYVLIQVEKFSFFTYFVVLDVKANSKIPLILGRPFMKTTGILVDIDKEVKFEIKKC